MKFIKKLNNKLKSNTGAMFGVDARISLLIFAVLSVVTGTVVTVNLTTIQAQALADELSKFTQSIEGLHHDLQDDIHSSLIESNDENAIAALYDPLTIKPGRSRARWLGPYIKYDSNFHPKYGKMLLTKRQEDHSRTCSPRILCFLWISFDNISFQIAEGVNEIFDGKNEDDPSHSGRIQWSEGKDRETVNLFFKSTKALKI